MVFLVILWRIIRLVLVPGRLFGSACINLQGDHRTTTSTSTSFAASINASAVPTAVEHPRAPVNPGHADHSARVPLGLDHQNSTDSESGLSYFSLD